MRLFVCGPVLEAIRHTALIIYDDVYCSQSEWQTAGLTTDQIIVRTQGECGHGLGC